MSDRYDLIIKPQVRRALTEVLAPSVAFAAWQFVNGQLRDNPRRVGKPLLAPFYCPECGQAYCRADWHTYVVFDEGFYDCTIGTCPAGHRHTVDD